MVLFQTGYRLGDGVLTGWAGAGSAMGHVRSKCTETAKKKHDMAKGAMINARGRTGRSLMNRLGGEEGFCAVCGML